MLTVYKTNTNSVNNVCKYYLQSSGSIIMPRKNLIAYRLDQKVLINCCSTVWWKTK